MSTKYKNIKNKKISIIGVSRKLGVTHMCLCLANFLSSALNKQVLYIEVSESSQLLGLVGATSILLHGITCFKHKGVTYALACNYDQAQMLISAFDGYVIVDLPNYCESTPSIFNQCDVNLVIGSTKPWCIRDLYLFLNTMKGAYDDRDKLRFFNQSQDKNDAKIFKNNYKYNMSLLPIINNPFSLKEEHFDALAQMIE